MKTVRSILIIDDSEADTLLATLAFEEAGAERFPYIMAAKNGEAALEMFRSYQTDRNAAPEGFPPSVILLDINMPGINGFEFLEQFESLRSVDGVESTVVIMASSSTDVRDQERASAFPFVRRFIIKPPRLKEALAIADEFGT